MTMWGMDTPRPFRKRPVIIYAQQYDADKAHRLVEPFKSAVCQLEECQGVAPGYNTGPGYASAPHIHTLEGVMEIKDLDWIIQGVKGEFYPCKPDIFEATYEPVTGLDRAYGETP